MTVRNLLQYPVTKCEIDETLMKLSKSLHSEEKVGDMRPMILQGMVKFMRERMSQQDLKEFFGIGEKS